MDSFDTSVSVNSQIYLVASVSQQQIEAAPTTKVMQTMTSLTVCDYLGGLSVMLIFIAITRIVFYSRFKAKSKQYSDVEILERIWKMDASKINH
ncbi:MAG: hypothetical protein IGS39_06765 [Calothrix sp. C42_A2020_038]|nr:hypothetical protein [Calothrix sp. C42_A2020_038]